MLFTPPGLVWYNRPSKWQFLRQKTLRFAVTLQGFIIYRDKSDSSVLLWSLQLTLKVRMSWSIIQMSKINLRNSRIIFWCNNSFLSLKWQVQIRLPIYIIKWQSISVKKVTHNGYRATLASLIRLVLILIIAEPNSLLVASLVIVTPKLSVEQKSVATKLPNNIHNNRTMWIIIKFR